MKRIVIAAEVFSSNLGDYAIYDSLSTILSLRDIEPIPLDISFRKSFPTNIANSHSKAVNSNLKALIPKKIKHHRLTQYIINRSMWYLVHKKDITDRWSNLISQSDAVIIGGGQLLTDTSANFHAKLALLTDIANKLNKPICILGCGVGSELSNEAQKNISKILNAAKYISVRDSNSAKRLIPLIENTASIKVYPDLAFALNPTHTILEDFESRKKICGFNIMPFDAFKRYNRNLSNFSEETYINFWKNLAFSANKENFQVQIMTNGSTQDYSQAKSVYNSLLSDGIDVTLKDRPETPSDLYSQISSVDYLVTTRMHAGIIGQAYGKSVATLIWDDKIPGVWQETGTKQIALNSDVILNTNPWIEINSAFEASRNLSISDLRKRVFNNIDECLNIIYS